LGFGVFSFFHHILEGLQPSDQTFPSRVFVEREDEKRDRGASSSLQPPFDELLKKSIDSAFKGGEKDDPICAP
jgi:hypothetical protein